MQYSDDEDEGKEGYKVGGYHTVKVRQCTAMLSSFASTLPLHTYDPDLFSFGCDFK